MTPLRSAALLFIAGSVVIALVGAQVAAPPSAIADGPPTQPGSAFASGVVLAANPQYGGLSLVVRGGQATASYTGGQTVADSQAVNLGYVGGLLGATYTAPLDALEAASAAGASSRSADGGIETVSVDPSPESAGATTSLSPVSISSLLSITGHSTAHVSYAGGKDQEADAATTMAVSLVGGLVTLNGLSWAAHQVMGDGATSTATFSMTSATVAGQTIDIVNPAQLPSVIALANKVLTGNGLTLTLPAKSTDAVTDTVTIGPLRLAMTGTVVTNTVLGALNPTETTLVLEIGKLLAADSNAEFQTIASYVGDAELVGGIVLGILAGGGVIDLDLGGASVDTEAAPQFVNPLAASGAQAPPSQPSSSAVVQPGVTPSGSSVVTTGGTPPLVIPGHEVATATPSSTALFTSLRRCVTTSPSGHPGCWSGAAPLGAALLLVIGGVLFASDIVRSRRRLIRPKEIL